MKLIQTLERPTFGYWDGGAKQVFEWTIQGEWTDKRGTYVKIGSWEANYFFHVAKGKSERQTLSYAVKHLKANNKISSTFEYVN